MKDLRLFKGISLDRILIVDNLSYCYAHQIDNGVPIVPYEGDDRVGRDKELIALSNYLKEAAMKASLSEFNKNYFKLEEIRISANWKEARIIYS